MIKERNYVYKGKNQRLTDYTAGETRPEFPMIALSFKESDEWSPYDLLLDGNFSISGFQSSMEVS